MTAYTSAIAGDVNIATNWTPNGIPNFANGDTALINKMMTIPAGVTFDPTVTVTGTSAGNRAGLHIYGRWHVRANATMNAFNDTVLYGGGVLDGAGSFGLRYTQLSTGVNNMIRTSGTTESNPAFITRSDWVSGEPSSIISTSTITSTVGAFVDVQHLIIMKMASVLMGGGAVGNHTRWRNVIWDDAGFCKIGGTSNRADDFIIEDCDYRHSNIAAISSPYFWEIVATRDSAGTATGIKRFKNVTLKHNDETSTKYVRAYASDYFTDISFVSDGVKLEFDSVNTPVTYKNICQRFVTETNFSVFGGLAAGTSFTESVTLIDATDYVVTGSFHAFQSRKLTTFKNNYCEEIFLQKSGIDGSDWYATPVSGAVDFSGNIFVLENGGSAYNCWTANAASDGTLQHNTVITRYSAARLADPYGIMMRTESAREFTGGNNQMLSNIVVVLDPSQSEDGYACIVNFKGAVSQNQLDTMDYNTYFQCSPNPPVGLFDNLNNTTKALGDPGFGANDNYIDPQFTNWPTENRNSPLLAFAASKGFANTKQLWGALLKLNGFNETTRRQESANATAYDVEDFLAYARACATPSNPLLAASAHDGTSRGAVQFTVEPTKPTGDNSVISARPLEYRSITARSITAR